MASIGEFDNARRNQQFYDLLLSGHDEDWEGEKLDHDAAHGFLAAHMLELSLFDGGNLIHEPEPNRVTETKRGKKAAYNPTSLGMLLTALLCSWTNFFAERFDAIGIGEGNEAGGVFLVGPQELGGYLADLACCAMRLALAHRDGKLDNFYQQRAGELPEALRNWVIANETEETDDSNE